MVIHGNSIGRIVRDFVVFPLLAHESCIKGATRVRRGVLKSTNIVDND